MTLPLIISVPHAGLAVPQETRDYCALTPEQILADSDEGAAEIYDLKSEVAVHITTDIARAVVDLNRAEDDRGRDGIFKTHTCYNARVYREPVPEDVVEILLERYYRPYHQRLSEYAADAKFGIDCHTMAAVGPPCSKDSERERPNICLSNAHGTCPQDWFEKLAQCFKESFDSEISVNHPFKGGYIIRSHSSELPWIQVEFSRAPFLQTGEKRERVLGALTLFSRMVLDV
ncbi:MAG: N-formylglutamate amidohydrolase [Planctomycetota bacterium]|jgi:N-formylglutamate amidohydrolase